VTARLVQNFRGRRGVFWGTPGAATETLQPALARLGMTLVRLPDLEPASLCPERDVLLVDGDSMLDRALVARPVGTLPTAPAIGLVGVEAPSRLKALSDIGVTAFLRKPVHGSAVYSSLFLAVNSYRRLRALEDQVAEHDRRRRGRRFVVKAVLELVQTRGMSDDEAYAVLRRESMRQRLGIEDYAEALVLRRCVPLPTADQQSNEHRELGNEARQDDTGGQRGDRRDAGDRTAGGDGGGPDQARRA